MEFLTDQLLRAVSMGFPLVLAAFILVAYRRLRLRSFLWLAAYALWGTVSGYLQQWLGRWLGTAYGPAGYMEHTRPVLVATTLAALTVSSVLLLVFLILVAREIGRLRDAPQESSPPPGGEAVELPR